MDKTELNSHMEIVLKEVLNRHKFNLENIEDELIEEVPNEFIDKIKAVLFDMYLSGAIHGLLDSSISRSALKYFMDEDEKEKKKVEKS
jgi:hypothetical protein